MRVIAVAAAVYWRLPEATGDDPKGRWYAAAVSSVNSRKRTIQIAYLEDGSGDDVTRNIEEEHGVTVWMENPVLNIEGPVVPKGRFFFLESSFINHSTRRRPVLA